MLFVKRFGGLNGFLAHLAVVLTLQLGTLCDISPLTRGFSQRRLNGGNAS